MMSVLAYSVKNFRFQCKMLEIDWLISQPIDYFFIIDNL